MSHAHHHIHKRKRIHQKHEKYPHPLPLKRFFDKAIYALGIIGPAGAIPQVYKIYATQDASSISLIMFANNLFLNVVWFTYGYLHKEKPLMLLYSCWAVINTAIVAGTILYG